MAKQYAARVCLPIPLRDEADNRLIQYGYQLTEVMFELKAKSESNAHTKVMREADRYVSHMYDGDVPNVPNPRIIAVCRLNGDGTPVRKSFKGDGLSAKVKVTPASTEYTETTKKPPPKPAVKLFDLTDPLTEELITSAAALPEDY